MIIKKMDALSLAKIQGLIGVIIGFIIGLFVGIVTSIMNSLTTVSLDGTEAGISSAGIFGGLGWLAVIVLPIIYGLMLFVGGLITAWLYNGLTKLVGGMKIELEPENLNTPAAQQPTQKQMRQ